VQTRCVNLKLNLSGLFLGEKCASLIAEWIRSREIEITRLDLGSNNLGDKGVYNISRAVCQSDSIYYLNLSQNGLSKKCAHQLYEMLRFNESVVQLEIGSVVGANPNRLGR
jgi:hypothetical protein